jgi:hypothetical protein
MTEKIQNVLRRREIIRLAVYRDAAKNGGVDQYLTAWLWNRPGSANANLPWAVDNAAIMMGVGHLPGSRIGEIIARSRKGKPLRNADALGQYLRLTNDVRTALKIRTIGARDLTKRQRTARRKYKQRERMARLRLKRGAQPHAQSRSQTKPWEKEGRSRSAWYRERKKKPVGQIRAHS